MTTTDAPRATISMWYAGQRRLVGGKIGHMWVTADDRERFFSKMDAKVVGAEYSIEVSDGGSTVYPHSLVYRPDGQVHRMQGEWLADHNADVARNRAERIENKARSEAGQSTGSMTIQQAAQWINRVHGADRRARIAVIIDALHI